MNMIIVAVIVIVGEKGGAINVTVGIGSLQFGGIDIWLHTLSYSMYY